MTIEEQGYWDGIKAAFNRGLAPVGTGGPGPEYIAYALGELDRLRALVRPNDQMLESRDLDRRAFEGVVNRLAQQPGEKYNLRELGDDDRRRAKNYALATIPAASLVVGLGTGYETGNFGAGALTGLGTAGIMGLLQHLGYNRGRSNLLNSAKVLKDYGLFSPTTLRRASPLITGQNYEY